MGFKADKSWVWRNMKEEEKEEDLWFHSEKLALAYGMLHSPPLSPLIISNDLRMCGNCHASTKLFSKMYLYVYLFHLSLFVLFFEKI